MTASFILPAIVTAIVAYLLGSFNFSIIVSRLYAGGDIREHGSGNAGMTNMLRTYGIKPAIYTALGDFLKGVVAICVARYLIFPILFGITNAGHGNTIEPGYIAGFFVLLGHVFPLYFNFKGGKAVMTCLAVVMVLDPLIFVVVLAIALPFIFKTRYVSLGSIIGAGLFPFLTLIKRLFEGVNPWYDVIGALLIGGTILFLHRGNIKRLLNGTEKKFTPPKK